MSTKPQPTETGHDRSFWQPPDKRDAGLSEDGRKWLDENAEAIKAWTDWAEKNAAPGAKYRPF